MYGKNNILGFISVSGYAYEQSSKYISFVSEIFDSNPDSVLKEYNKLKASIPDKARIDTLVLPLCKMLELAYIKEHNEPEPYSLSEAICRYIQRNYSIDLTANHICEHFSCSKSYFSHNFKSYTGKSFREYLTDTRLNYAKQLLEHSELNITQISFSVGFNDSNYFSNIFKQKTGISPLAYRKSKKQ